MPFDLARWAKNRGWAAAGACDGRLNESTREHFLVWLQDYKGPQMEYLNRRGRERLSPELYFHGLKSILCFGFYYFPGWAQGEAKVSNYSWSTDYHQLMRERLERTALDLQETLSLPFKYRVSVDTAPIMEKAFAEKAALGWQGKNTLLLHRQYGSYMFLGELLTDISLEIFQVSLPESDHCGTCTKCIEACPTQALEPYILDAKKCISYWTLEHKGAFSETTPKYSEWIAGCDICQEVCPWNQKLLPLATDSKAQTLQNLRVENVKDPSWNAYIEDRAVAYIPPENWNRNLDWISETHNESSKVELRVRDNLKS